MAREQLVGAAGRAGAGCGVQLAGGVVILGLTALLFDRVRDAFDPLRRDAEFWKLERARQLADDLYTADLAAGWAWRLVPTAAAAVFLCGLAVVVLVILYRQLAAWQTLRARHMIALTRAQVQRFPEGLQTLAFHDSSRETPMLPPPAWGEEAGDAEEAEEGEGVRTFAQLLDAGRVGRGADGRALPLLLGFDVETGAELVGSWLDLYSTAVAGFPGSGKTTTQRFLAAQTALHGARFVIIDPQAEAGEESLAGTLAPLQRVFLAEPASDERRILEAVRLVADIGERRVKGLDQDTTPVILWADELTKLLGRSSIGEELAQLLEAVAQEYRKKRVFVCGSGQIWTAERTTSELRDSFASVIAHRMKRGQARMLLPTEDAARAERLPTGRAILWRTSGETTVIAVPLTTAADVTRVAGLLAGDAPTMPRVARSVLDVYPGSAEEPAVNTSATRPLHVEYTSGRDVYSASESARTAVAPPDPQTARILARFASGTSLHDLAAELAGTKNTNASAYRAARQQIEAMLRGLVPGGAR